MANNPQTPNHDFFQQLLDMQTYAAIATGGGGGGGDPNLDVNLGGGAPMMVQLNSGLGRLHGPPVFPLGLSLDGNHGPGPEFRDDTNNNHNTQHHIVVNGGANSGPKSVFQGQPMSNSVSVGSHQTAVRPRVRARRGQATDPHSIAERLRRERIAERIRALQELVPSVNKTDRAAMLDEIVDYVKFLRLQVKVLSMSRLGGAGAVVPLVTDMPIPSIEEEGGEGQPVWEKWSNDGTERQIAKLMEENVGAAMQFLQSKALCIMPISLASAIYHIQPPDSASIVKPESIPPL